MQPNLGLLDCGATASAGPETSVQKLISSVLAQDSGATVTIAKYMRPYFRFGNGWWGQASFRASISSSVSGVERTFHTHCLPDPKNGDVNNMVPVLLGMDHLSGKDAPESVLTIDFLIGLAVEPMNPQPVVHQLQSSKTGHYVRDVVKYLTMVFFPTMKCYQQSISGQSQGQHQGGEQGIDKEFTEQNPMGYMVGGRPKAKASPARAWAGRDQLGCDSRITSLPQRLGGPPHCRREEPACAAHDRASPSGCGINTCAGACNFDCGLPGRHGMKIGMNETYVPVKPFEADKFQVSKELYGKIQPLTNNVATKVMLFASTMIAAVSATMMDFTLDSRDGLWEIACAPHSWLTQAAEQHGLQPRRINLQSGFDLHLSKTWERLDELRRQRRPKRLWWSLPCTHWCHWSALNCPTPEQLSRKKLLETYRRKDRKLLWREYGFIKKAIQEDPEVILFWECPHPCYGWNQEPMLAIERLLQQHGHEWLDCRIDGCRYHMRDVHGDFRKKKWKIKTVVEHFRSQFRANVCVGAHCHGRIVNQETAKSADYPWQMAQSCSVDSPVLGQTRGLQPATSAHGLLRRC